MNTQPAFETGTIQLQIRTQHFFTNIIKNITPPEFLILRELHGPSAPTLIEITGNAIETRMNESGRWMKRPMREAELREYLRVKYKDQMFQRVYPGASARLHKTFAEIEVQPKPIEGMTTTYSPEDDGWEFMSGDEVKDKNLPSGGSLNEIAKMPEKTPVEEEETELAEEFVEEELAEETASVEEDKEAEDLLGDKTKAAKDKKAAKKKAAAG